MAFDRGDFHRLVLKSVEAVEVADHCLHRGDDQCHPHGHRQHLADRRIIAAAQQVPGGRSADEERGSNKGGSSHVCQAIRERRVEDHREPVHRDYNAVDDFVTLRGLHPAVGGKNPERGNDRTDGHHDRGKEVQATADTVPAKQHDAEETGLEEEGGKHFIGQKRPGDGTGKVGELAPVGTELIGHDQTGDHTHAEVDGKDFRPEVVKVTVDTVVGLQPQAFEHRQVTRQANGDGRKQDVERHGKRELNSGEI
ncbi:hypothetical protein D9M73_166270 [compost metagenome]